MAEQQNDQGGTSQSEGSAPATGAGISNRETPQQEEQERHEHPPVETDSPPPQDAAGRVGEEPLDDLTDRHTSHKAGVASIAQKEGESKYPDRSMPPSRKVAGAFGREPGDPLPRDTDASASSDHE